MVEPTNIPNILANNPQIIEGISFSKNSKKVQTPVPKVIESMAPSALAFFQYRPDTKGTNNATKLKAEDSPTSS